MRLTSPLLLYAASPLSWFLILTAVLASTGPVIDVSLQASFNKPPFLLELLETAAQEEPASYLPLLNRIADGAFSKDSTDEQLYVHFQKALQDEGFITGPAALSSFQFALSIHSAAPRIEAHYQFYWTSVKPFEHTTSDTGCVASIWQEESHLCFAAQGGEIKQHNSTVRKSHSNRKLDFDRDSDFASIQPVSTLYANILSPRFGQIYKQWRQIAGANVACRLRYMPSAEQQKVQLIVSGYGVELALKRTDYIVIDDREADGHEKEGITKQDNATDVKPLSSSELLDLGIKASSFIMESENPFDTLLDISQDFPKHSADLVLHNISTDFQEEFAANQELQARPGANALWINGVQIDALNVDAFSLLEHLRRERKLVNGFEEVGFSPPEAISILSHKIIAEAQADDDAQRYDWRDKEDGGNVIIWLNNIEKDKRYTDWPAELRTLLQRTFPGQIPAVRRDIHNLVVPVDYTDPKQVAMVIDQLKTFVTRRIPLRIGIVPAGLESLAAVNQAKVLYHLNDAYGLTAVMDYLQGSFTEKELSSPSQLMFDTVIKDRKLRKGQAMQELSSVLQSEPIETQIVNARRYLGRLGVTSNKGPVFVNGVPVAIDENWVHAISSRIGLDLRTLQQRVFEEALDEDSWVPNVFLEGASSVRNPLVIPEDDKDVKIIDISKLYKDHGKFLKEMPALKLSEAEDPVATDRPNPFIGSATLLVIVDLNSDAGRQLLLQAISHANEWHTTEITIVHSSDKMAVTQSSIGSLLTGLDSVKWLQPGMKPYISDRLRRFYMGKQHQTQWDDGLAPLLKTLDISPGQPAVMVGGRLIGPIPESETLLASDFETLVTYERQKRMLPLNSAIEALGFVDRVDNPPDAARLSSLVALSTISDVPEGIFDTTPGPRFAVFENWTSEHTAVKTGDKTTATLQIVASLDPASETAQRWIPILKVLSELDGVYSCIFLSPSEKIRELPVKRFYRYVLESKPSFDKAGGLKNLHARFDGIPTETLLTMTMDVPPSWLVAPKNSMYDLDNIKLSNLKTGENVEALYELEHILIEGHSRDVTAGPPPRGVQLLLGTDSNPDFAGTIIMANIGYFQFKANPGIFNLALQEGRSQEIFNIDSAGTKGYGAHPGDETTEISLTSFQGVTLFPRLSRNLGKEQEDVLEPAMNSAAQLVAKGTDIADALLSKAGIPNARTASYLSKGVQLGQSILSAAGLGLNPAKASQHADINIFSVASGHLYERMLNIMMVSVLRHTTKTVKFWFIEQFLSPSFKESLPYMAQHYNFTYSMVTYKWPHWLRAQKEKQRVIWGYKILFLDVLFPLDLDKVIFVDADQIVRTDMWDLVNHDLEGAPYGFTPMCDSRTEMEGFRFWKQGYWKNFLQGLPYHISALYVVDLVKFRQMAAGDRLRQQYHQLSRDPESLSNLDQDLPNHMQLAGLEIHSLPQEWLWCETWCSDEALKDAKTIDLCNNPLTKEPKLDRARRQVPEWTELDEEIAGVLKRATQKGGSSREAVPPHQSANAAPPPSSSISQKDEL